MVFSLQKAIFRYRELCTRLHFVFYINLILLRILENISFKPALGGTWFSVNYAKIALGNLAVAYLFVHYAQSLSILRGNDNAAGIAVYAITERGSKGILLSGPPLALLISVGLNIGNERVIIPRTGTVAKHSGLIIVRRGVETLR